MRLTTCGKPRVISCGETFPEHIGLPRGRLEEANFVRPSLHRNCARSGSEMAGSYAALLQVFLVILFGAIERSCGRDFGGNGAFEFAADIDSGA